jgi:hypothetical protein
VDLISFAEVGSIFFDESELNAIAAYDYGKHFVVTSMDGRLAFLMFERWSKSRV